MSGLEPALGVVRSAIAVPIASAAPHATGIEAWAGRRVGALVLDDGLPTARTIDARLPEDTSKFQYVSDVPSEAVKVARASALRTRQAHVTLEDARTGAWHVAGVVDAHGAPLAFDEAGAIRQPFTTARFDTNHLDAGSLHGEAHDLPLRPEVQDAIDQLAVEAYLPELPAVDTDSASTALAAIERRATSAAAPMRASALTSRALEPVAHFEPLTTVPAAIRADRFDMRAFPDAWYHTVRPNVDEARIVSGERDDVVKLARRMSGTMQNQTIAGYRLGGDRYALVPIQGEDRNFQLHKVHRSEPIPMDSSSAPEIEFTANHRGAWTRDGSTLFIEGPLTLARRIRDLTARVETEPTTLVTARSAKADADAELARLEREHADAGAFAKLGLGGQVRRARERVRFADGALQRETKQFTANQAKARAELRSVISKVERHHLPEREEWVARAPHNQYGVSNLGKPTPAPAGATFEDLVRAGRDETADSATSGHVVLEAIDGTLWTAPYRTDAKRLAEAVSSTGRANSTRFDPAVRAVSVGGRTVQWTGGRGVLA